jgi:hypothetical protein
VVIGLYRSVAMVVTLMRTNLTQEVAGDIFGCSQATVSRRWDLLRPAIGQVLAGCVPDPRQILGGGTALVDGTIAPTWDWAAITDLFSGKAGYPGMNLQIAATLGGRVAAIGPDPVHGARHDAHAFAASGLKALLAGLPAAADLGLPGRGGHRHRAVPDSARRAPAAGPSRFQQGTQRHLRGRRARRSQPQDLAHAVGRRRPLPRPDHQIRRDARSRNRGCTSSATTTTPYE